MPVGLFFTIRYDDEFTLLHFLMYAGFILMFFGALDVSSLFRRKNFQRLHNIVSKMENRELKPKHPWEK